MKSVKITADGGKETAYLMAEVSTVPDKHGVVGNLRNLSAGIYDKALFPIFRKETKRGYEYSCPLS